MSTTKIITGYEEVDKQHLPTEEYTHLSRKKLNYRPVNGYIAVAFRKKRRGHMIGRVMASSIRELPIGEWIAYNYSLDHVLTNMPMNVGPELEVIIIKSSEVLGFVHEKP